VVANYECCISSRKFRYFTLGLRSCSTYEQLLASLTSSAPFSPSLALHPSTTTVTSRSTVNFPFTNYPIDQHGGSSATVEVHVPVPLQNVPRHPPLTLHHGRRPRCFSCGWSHVQSPGPRSPLPNHGQSARRPERTQRQQRSCRSFWRSACLPHPCESRQVAHFFAQRGSGYRN